MALCLGLHFMVPYLCAGTRPSPRPGVDLEKIRKQEEERRKKAPKSKHSFTDEDLKKAKSSTEKTNITEMTTKKDESAEKKEKEAENQGNAAEKETAADAVTAEGQGNQGIDGQSTLKAAMKTESYWKDEKNRIQTEIRNLETLVKEDEDKLAQLKNRYYVQGIDMLTEQLRVEKDMNELAVKIDGDKASLEALKQELEDLYEKARREGVPPGWLRD